MNIASLNYFGIAPTRSSGVSTEVPVKLNKAVVQQVFELVKLLGLRNTSVLCISNILQSGPQQAKGKPSIGADDLVDLLRHKGLEAELDKDGLHIHVQGKKVYIGWLYQLSQEDLKKADSLLTSLETNKQTILDAFKTDKNRDEKITIYGSWHESMHIVAQEGRLYLDLGLLKEQIPLLNLSDVLVLFKENLNGLKLTGYTFKDLDLSGANLAETDFSDSTFKNVNLTGAIQEGMIIKRTTFDRVIGFELCPTTVHSDQPNETKLIRTAIQLDAKRYFSNDVLLIKSKGELRFLLSYFTSLKTTQLAQFKQTYPNVYKQLFEKGLNWELYSSNEFPCFGNMYYEGEWIPMTRLENRELHDRAVELYRANRSQIYALEPMRLRKKIWEACKLSLPNLCLPYLVKDSSRENYNSAPHDMERRLCSLIDNHNRGKELTSFTLPQDLLRITVLYILVNKDVMAATAFSYDLRLSADDLDTAKKNLIASLPEQLKKAFELYVEKHGFGNLLADGVAALNNEGIAVSINTVESMTSFQQRDGNGDMHNVIYRKLSLKAQRSLSVTCRFNDAAYRKFWEFRIQQRPFEQMQRDYLANKVLGPNAMMEIETGKLSLHWALEQKRGHKKLTVNDYRVASGKSMYVSDKFLTSNEIYQLGLERTEIFNNQTIQFLINSGRLKKEQLREVKPYHLEHLEKPYIRHWITDGRLSITAFLKFTEKFLGYLRQNTFIHEYITTDQLCVESLSKLIPSERKQLTTEPLKGAVQYGVLTVGEAVGLFDYYSDIKSTIKKYLAQGYSVNAALWLMNLLAKEVRQENKPL